MMMSIYQIDYLSNFHPSVSRLVVLAHLFRLLHLLDWHVGDVGYVLISLFSIAFRFQN